MPALTLACLSLPFFVDYPLLIQVLSADIVATMAMIVLFVFISMIERKLSRDKPGYPDDCDRTFAVIPLSTLKGQA